MKKFIPYLLFSATTLHTLLGVSPIMAIGCDSHSDEIESVCEKDEINCSKDVSPSTLN
tara:strand:- start:453 stop:626 length:174 start_codon:yes stop_codon:yes gene_type:complete